MRRNRLATGNSTTRTEGMYLQLPELQEMRDLGRLMQLKIRVAILDGKTDEAMHWIENGLVMGRHISQGPLLIQALIGISIGRTMTARLEELIQAPSGPSLCWALADRNRPFIDMRRAMDGERHVLEKELPDLPDLERGAWGLDQARQFVDTLQRKLFDLASGQDIPGTYIALPFGLPDLSRRLGIAAMAAKIYPEAKHTLIARGRTQAQVEAMPVTQVAALYSMEEYQRIRDGSYKWVNVPYWQSYNQIDRAILSAKDEKLANPLVALFLMLTQPSTESGWRPSGSIATSTRCSVSRRSVCTPTPTRANCPTAWRRSPMPRCPSIPRRESRFFTR